MFWFWHRRSRSGRGRARSRQAVRLLSHALPRNHLAPQVEPLEVRCLLSAAPTSITVLSSAAAVTAGQAVNVTATVSSTTIPSEGTVTFFDGSTQLGTGNVTGGTADLVNVTLPLGSNVITASYFDSLGNYASSISTTDKTVVPSSTITTVAGTGTADYLENGGAATSTVLTAPPAVAVDSAGDLFIADSADNVVREVNAATGAITTIVGTGVAGYSGDGSQASASELNSPQGLAVNSAGDLFIADQKNARVREVNLASGAITTYAGNGTTVAGGNGGQATAAGIGNPAGLALDSAGDLYVTDVTNNTVREINTSGVITTVAGAPGTGAFGGDGAKATAASLNHPSGVAVDGAGDLFIADSGNNRVREVNAQTLNITTVAGTGAATFGGDNGQATAAPLNSPSGVAVDTAGHLFIADESNNRVREVTIATGIITTLAGTGTAGFSGDGAASTAAKLSLPSAVALDAAGHLFIADQTNNRIREVTLGTGVITTVAGVIPGYEENGNAATLAPLNSPQSVAVDSAGDLFIAEAADNVVREVNHATGLIVTIAGTGVAGFTGNGGQATAATLNAPYGVAVSAAGNLFIADSGNSAIREVNLASGLISTFAGGTYGTSGNGGQATAAGLELPSGIALDSSGDLFITDVAAQTVREVKTTGVISAVAGVAGSLGFSGDNGQATAATLDFPYGVAVDAAGDVFIADEGNNRVREVNATSGVITTIAGSASAGYSGDNGAATAAKLDQPYGVAVNSVGNLFIADRLNDRIREVNLATGVITSVAGNGTAGYAGDVGSASVAELSNPFGVAVDAGGDLFIADQGNNRIRAVTAATIVTVSPPVAHTPTVTNGGASENFAATSYESTTGLVITVNPLDVGVVKYYEILGITNGSLYLSDGVTPVVDGEFITVAEGNAGLKFKPTAFLVSPSSTFSFTVQASTIATTAGLGGSLVTALIAVNPPAPTTTTVVSSAASVAGGSAVTLTATVASATTPSEGTVTFYFNGPAPLPPTQSVPVINGTASLKVTLSLGINVITGTYNDSVGNYAGSSTILGPNSVINTVAGAFNYIGDGGPASLAAIVDPESVIMDSAGDLFIADTAGDRIREVNAQTGVISTYAGNGTAGFSGDGGEAIAASLHSPEGIAFDKNGDLFIADDGNNRIREVNGITQAITTIAGVGAAAFSGDGGQATAAALNGPIGVVVDTSGDLFIADSGNSRIREVNAITQLIATVAGNGVAAYGGDGGQATAAPLNTPKGVALDTAGDLLIADTLNDRIREVNAVTQVITTIAGNGTGGFAGDGGTATAAELNGPFGVTLDASGNLYVSDTLNNRIREINAVNQTISTLAGNGTGTFNGDGTVAAATSLFYPTAVAFDSAGDVYVADDGNSRVREIAAKTQLVSTFAGGTPPNFTGDGSQATAAKLGGLAGIAVDSAGDLFIADSVDNRIREVNAATGAITTIAGGGAGGDNGQATAAALLGPTAVVVDSAGDLFIADSGDNRIREVNAATQIITTVAGNGTAGSTGNAGQATAAELNNPQGLALDSAGDLFIADTQNDEIREVNAATGVIAVVAGNGTPGYSGNGGQATAAELNLPAGIALDSVGDLYIADTGNNRIREVNATTKLISKVAGSSTTGFGGDAGPATAAALNQPTAIAVDSAGDLFIADQGNSRIREVNSAGIITTLAGTALVGYTGDGGSPTAAELNSPDGVILDASGDLFIADHNNDLVREIGAGAMVTVTSPVTLHIPAVSNSISLENGQTKSGLVITPNPADKGTVTYFQITGITGGSLFQNDGVTQITNGQFITVTQGVTGLRFSPTLNSSAPGSFTVQAATNATTAGLGGTKVTATIAVTASTTGPTSSVNPLPLRTSLLSIPVSWSATPGTGGSIVSYNISVSTDGGPFISWLSNTALTSSNFTATLGHAYGFISQATDASANVEPAHATADATITTTLTPWQNPVQPLDVLNLGNGIVPADALAVINYLNTHTSDVLPPTFSAGSYYVDVAGLDTVTPNDALTIINYLNNHPGVTPAVSADASNVTPAAVVATAASAVRTDSQAPASAAASTLISPPLPSPNEAPVISPAVVAAGSLSTPTASLSPPPASAVPSSAASPQPVLQSPATASQSTDGNASTGAIDSLLSDPFADWLD